MRTFALAAALALTAGAAFAQTLEEAAFGRDGGEIAPRNRAPNYNINFKVPANTGVTFAIPSGVTTAKPTVQANGALDAWSTNDGWLCFGTASQTCPASLPTPTTTPSTSLVTAASKGVVLTPVGGARIISVTAYAKVSDTEFWIDVFKPKGQ